MPELAQYIAERLEETRQNLALDYAEYKLAEYNHPLATAGQRPDSPRSHAIVKSAFQNNTLGFLSSSAELPGSIDRSILSELEAAASQLAPLMRHPRPALAIALDRKVAALTQYSQAFDWCGIYLLEGDRLYLTAFRGAPTPHAIISTDRGICGAAIRENQTLNIPDVNQDTRYLSCSLKTRSELVVPIRDNKGEAIGEVDIDSHTRAAFTPAHIAHIEDAARELSQLVLQ